MDTGRDGFLAQVAAHYQAISSGEVAARGLAQQVVEGDFGGRQGLLLLEVLAAVGVVVDLGGQHFHLGTHAHTHAGLGEVEAGLPNFEGFDE